MWKAGVVLLVGLVLTGCAAQAPGAAQEQSFEQRLQSLEQRQQELEAELEQAKKERAELAKRIGELQAAQQAMEERQATLEQSVTKWANDVTTALQQTQKAASQRAVLTCKDPWTRLQEKLAGMEGTPTAITLQTLSDLAVREYEACLRTAGR